ncbi:ATP-binding protein [Sinomonas sp. JGH33]|uniref:ATP-binding protein n=1 Tax=Sinomonas terricola TaxID=3110330 RepID=A0ABU5T900_9MICC|nr:ATP-binding protein [Sinomonas sp. JGH33]MEA5455921.1 ATP-binding protein [Sinomonas sp. JGH33]
MQNPFRPTAGATPPVIVSRHGILSEFEYGLTIRSGAPGLLTIFTGTRGIGKTVMLSAAEEAAQAQGWLVISETATAGFMARIGEAMRRAFEELGEKPSGRRITGVTLAGFGVTTQLAPEEQVGWREAGEKLLNALDTHGTGLAITVDEVHAADRGEIAALAANVQHFIREGLPIALVFAGLPSAVSDLLNEGVATFLRRADRIDLHAASVDETADSYAKLFAQGGHSLEPALARAAAEATGGYPFLIQLVGYSLWQEAEAGPLTADAVGRAIAAARRRNERTVIEAALSTASARDMDFLAAMADDDGTSEAGEIGRRMAASPSLVGKYRARLIDAGLVEPAGYGRVEFAIPGLREYLRSRVRR